MFSLLSEPLIGVRSGGANRERAALPEILARLGQGEELEPTAIRPHQHHAWHAFLVQLAALVAHRAGDRRLDLSSEAWRKALLDLSGDAGESAWCVVEPDLSRPAFFQPPVPEGSLVRFGNLTKEPDAIDVLITARNHDVKEARMGQALAEHWIYALVTLQTMEGFLGRGNFGIARMNGGFASRPAVGAAPGLGWAERFRRDAGLWLDSRQSLLQNYPYRSTGGAALLWLLPWDGKTSHGLEVCDPFFIEVCRRLRLTLEGDVFVARSRSTECAFLRAKEINGDTGDVWTPVRSGPAGTVALTVGHGGFSYKLLTDLLFPGEFERKPALALRPEDGAEPVVMAQVLVRGQGKTAGYHQRVIPIPAPVRAKLTSTTEAASLGTLARDRIEVAGRTQQDVLKPALCALLQGGPDTLDLRDKRSQPWLDRFDAAVDATFFDDLWGAANLSIEAANEEWNERLRTLASEQLKSALHAAPIPLATRPRAMARAQLIFGGRAAKHLPLNKKQVKQETQR